MQNEERNYTHRNDCPDRDRGSGWPTAVDLGIEYLVPRVGYPLHCLDMVSRSNFGRNSFNYQGETVRLVID